MPRPGEAGQQLRAGVPGAGGEAAHAGAVAAVRGGSHARGVVPQQRVHGHGGLAPAPAGHEAAEGGGLLLGLVPRHGEAGPVGLGQHPGQHQVAVAVGGEDPDLAGPRRHHGLQQREHAAAPGQLVGGELRGGGGGAARRARELDGVVLAGDQEEGGGEVAPVAGEQPAHVCSLRHRAVGPRGLGLHTRLVRLLGPQQLLALRGVEVAAAAGLGLGAHPPGHEVGAVQEAAGVRPRVDAGDGLAHVVAVVPDPARPGPGARQHHALRRVDPEAGHEVLQRGGQDVLPVEVEVRGQPRGRPGAFTAKLVSIIYAISNCLTGEVVVAAGVDVDLEVVSEGVGVRITGPDPLAQLQHGLGRRGAGAQVRRVRRASSHTGHY